MLVDASGAEQVFTTEEVITNIGDSSGPYWIAVPGCVVDLEGKTDEQLVGFSQNEFTIKIHDVKNPELKNLTSNFIIEVFKKWDSINNEGLEKISES